MACTAPTCRGAPTWAITRTRVVVYFADVLDLVPQSAVKVNDVAVGKVKSIRLSRTTDGAAAGVTAAGTAAADAERTAGPRGSRCR